MKYELSYADKKMIVDVTDDQVTVDQHQFVIASRAPSAVPTVFTLGQKTYKIYLVDQSESAFTLSINGTWYTLGISDPRSFDAANTADALHNELKAKIPGLVTKIQIKPGDVVKKGDVLLSLEAMKMENQLRAERDAKIAGVAVNVGDSVAVGQILIQFESHDPNTSF